MPTFRSTHRPSTIVFGKRARRAVPRRRDAQTISDVANVVVAGVLAIPALVLLGYALLGVKW